jgi:predicted negative regulator of RcsB-dependent stress response
VAGILGFIPIFTFVISLFGLGSVILAGWRVFRGHQAEPGGTAPATMAP